MDKKKFVSFSLVSLALVLFFIVINIFILKKINKNVTVEVRAYNYYSKGLGYCVKGEFIKAEKLFKKALELDKSNDFPQFALETLADFNRGVINKEYTICFLKGIKYSEDFDYQEAIDEFENAVKMNPNYVKAYNCIGNAYQALRNSQEAIVYYKKAIQIAPDYIKAYNNLGGEYFSLKRYQEALDCAEKALQINPNDAQNYCNLGLAYSFLKKPQQARENFQKAKDIYQQQKDATNLMRVENALKKITGDNFAADGSVKGELQ